MDGLGWPLVFDTRLRLRVVPMLLIWPLLWRSMRGLDAVDVTLGGKPPIMFVRGLLARGWRLLAPVLWCMLEEKVVTELDCDASRIF